MKSFKFISILILSSILLIVSCSKKFDENSKNKNLPLDVPAGLILRTVLNDIVVFPGGDEDKQCQFYASNYTYYGANTYWSGSASLNYGSLNNVVSMENEARKANGSDNNPYHALGLFLRSYFFVTMSEKVGDLPMKDALKGVTNLTPKYDSQKDIFKQSLVWLDSANIIMTGLLSNGFTEFSGDFYYKEAINSKYSGNNGRDALVEWQKVINSYRLRVLIELSKKAASDADLNIPAQFNTIVSNPTQYPIFTSNADNLQYVYNSTYNYYPNNTTNYGNDQIRLNIGGLLETTLGKLHDLRCMVLGEPARGLGFSDTSYSSYVGAPLGSDLSTLANLNLNGKISLLNRNHWYATLTGEPTFILSYPEVCFCIAEGINRGWTTGNADTWYQNGVKAMFAFYGIVDGANTVVLQKPNGGLGDNINYTVTFNFSDYFNQPSVKYAGNNATGLGQILLQKYLAYARNSGYQAYFQWRRTGIPTFDVGPGNGNGGVIPLRFQYPTNEISANASNYTAAVQSQYAGSDNINAIMWLIK